MQCFEDQRNAQSVVDRQRGAAAKDVSAVVVNYNGAATVLDTVESILAQEGVRTRVIVVDDGSTDGSPDAVAARFPDVAVHREPRNTKNVNRLRNIGLSMAETDKVVVADNDVHFHPTCFAEMLAAMESDARVALCIPRMMYAQDPDTVYMAGGSMHYIGATIAPDRHMPFDGNTEPRARVAGGIALYDKQKLARVGPYDEEYLLAWGDDVEIHQRLLLAGFKGLYVPSAVCLHHYKPFDGSRSYRARGQVCNRWRYMLSHYEARTLLLIAPALVLYELTQALFLTLKGLPHLYVQGTLDALYGLPRTLRRRREVQALRTVSDRHVLFSGELYVRPEHSGGRQVATKAIKGLSRVLDWYWRMIQPLLSETRAREADVVPKGHEA
ncbi:MAG TPA: glycosyltransferase [Gammaproteobacteria bacterium]